MSEYKAIGVRVENRFLDKIESLGKKENLDRSSIMRMLLIEGYKNYIKKKVAEEYMQGRITMSKAADTAGITIWEMQQYLISMGFKSDYSIKDLGEEMELITSK